MSRCSAPNSRCRMQTLGKWAFYTVLCLYLAGGSAVSGDTISDVNVLVASDGYSRVEERIIFESEGEYGLLAAPQFTTQDLTFSDETGNLTYEYADIDGTKALKVIYNGVLSQHSTKEVWLRYGTHYLTAKSAGVWSFNIETPSTPRKTIVRVTLPPGAKLLSLKPEGVLRTYVGTGFWVYPQETEFNLTATYQYEGEKSPAATTTLPGGILSYVKFDAKLVYGLFLAGLAIIVAWIGYTLYRDRISRKRSWEPMTVNIVNDLVTESKDSDGSVSYNIDASSEPRGAKRVKESILKMLDANELEIIRLLENADEDEVTQAYIYKTTGIPKSSLSDIIKHIEKRNILERRVDGRVKWIKLKSWVLE
jgi:uncharacterized membrane protein